MRLLKRPATSPSDQKWLSAAQKRDFLIYLGTVILAGFAVQIQTITISWHVYQLTHNPIDLALVGLSQFMPALVLILVTGSIADRFPRKLILRLCLAVETGVAVTLTAFAHYGFSDVRLIYAALIVFGTSRAFYNPARQAIVSNLVPPEILATALTKITTANKLASVCGPIWGGFLYTINAELAFGSVIFGLAAAFFLAGFLPKPKQFLEMGKVSWASLMGGIDYIWSQKIVLGAITLDLFAVILGGATALLPMFAEDILQVGSQGLGFLRAAPALGAISGSLILIRFPITNYAGRIMFAAVVSFGLFTIVFALSPFFLLSLAALYCAGACDTISVYVRGVLIQLWTPDEVRGRVNAINQLCIGASNEIGAFRAGTMAAFISPVATVLIGGIGALLVAGLWASGFKSLRDIKGLTGPQD